MNILQKINIAVSSFLLKMVIQSISHTLKVSIHGVEDVKGNALFAFWHSSTFVLAHATPIKKMAILIADGPKGDVFMNAVKDYGNKIIRMDFDEKPASNAIAAMKILKAIAQGYSIGLAVDGPKGPLHSVKAGVFVISGRSGKKIFPVGIYYSKKLSLGFRWDKYRVPLPFSKVCIYVDNNFIYTLESGEAEAQNLLRDAILSAENKAKMLLSK